MRKLGRMVLAASMVVVLAGCNEPKAVTGEEFMAMHARNPESVRHTV
jgi:outer membrane lipoprotein SlyB